MMQNSNLKMPRQKGANDEPLSDDMVENLELKLKALGIVLFANFVDITLKVRLRVSNNI